MLPIAILSGSKNARVFDEKGEDDLYVKGKMHRNVYVLLVRAPSKHLPAKNSILLIALLVVCMQLWPHAYRHHTYTSYMIVYASTFRSIMLLLWCYDVLQCPSKCTSCTYYIVVLHVTRPLVHESPSPTIERRNIRHRPSTLRCNTSKCSASAQIMIQ